MLLPPRCGEREEGGVVALLSCEGDIPVALASDAPLTLGLRYPVSSPIAPCR